MLQVRSDYIQSVTTAQKADDLYPLVQAAIELEHATIPPYLTAAFSLKPGANDAARQIILSIANEEMLHLTIAANLLNAIGGRPEIDKPGFIPLYPGKLPMMIDDGLIVGLRKANRQLVNDVFMRIEEPEVPLDIQVRPRAAAARGTPTPPPFPTIGRFYEALKSKIQGLGNEIFKNPSNPQVIDNTWFAPDLLFRIVDVDSACRAIDVVVDQGEGTKKSPEGPGGRPAHYYRFREIVEARLLIKDRQGYAYAGDPVSLDPEGVWNLYPDPKAADYAAGSRARNLVERFNYSYTALLRTLHQAFNGAPATIDTALGLMFELRLLAADVVATPVGSTGMTATPSFEYTLVPV
jgi:rubrerythrin